MPEHILEGILKGLSDAIDAHYPEQNELDVQECKEKYGDPFTDIFIEYRKPGETPAQFHDRAFAEPEHILEGILKNLSDAIDAYYKEQSELDVQECREEYGDQFTDMYIEYRKPGETPEQFYDRAFADVICQSPQYLAKVREMECGERNNEYNDVLADLYTRYGKGGESLDEFHERCKDRYEHFDEILAKLADYDELQDIDLDTLEELELLEDYGMTDEEMDSGDDDDWI